MRIASQTTKIESKIPESKIIRNLAIFWVQELTEEEMKEAFQWQKRKLNPYEWQYQLTINGHIFHKLTEKIIIEKKEQNWFKRLIQRLWKYLKKM